MSTTLENVLLEELRDLTVRTEVLQTALGTVISLMDGAQQDTIIKMLTENMKVVSREDPRVVAATTAKELADYALLPAGAMRGRPNDV